MDEKKPKERIKLRNNQQTAISIGFARGGKSTLFSGDKIAVASSAATIISARFNPETGFIDVVPIEGALGESDVSVGITLADGAVLPPQIVQYTVVHPDAEAVVLTPRAIGEKTTIIVNPQPNAEPHVVSAPPEHVVPAPPDKKAAPDHAHAAQQPSSHPPPGALAASGKTTAPAQEAHRKS